MATAPDSSIKIFSWFFDHIDQALSSYVFDHASRAASMIAPVAITLFGIFVLLWGFAHLQNKVEEPVTDGAFRLIKVAFVLGFALNVGIYSSYIVNFAMNTPLAAASVIGGTANDGQASTRIGENLDKLANKSFAIGQRAWDKSGIRNVGLAFVAILIWIAMAIVLLFAALLIIIAEVGLALVLAVGPIFIMLVLFQATQRFFEVWVGHVINFMVTILLAVLAVRLLMDLTNDFLGEVLAPVNVASSTGKVLFEIVVVGGIGVLILRQVPALASSFGGIALSTLGSFGASMGGAKGIGDKVTGKSIRDAAKHQRVRAKAVKYNAARDSATSSVANAFRRKNAITR